MAHTNDIDSIGMEKLQLTPSAAHWKHSAIRLKEQHYASLRKFLRPAGPPRIDADGYYKLDGADRLLPLLGEEIDHAIATQRSFQRLVTQVLKLVPKTRERWTRAVQMELKKRLDSASDCDNSTVARDDYLGAYLIAVANDQVRSVDSLDAIFLRTTPSLTAKKKDLLSVTYAVEQTTDHYVDLAQTCLDSLVQLILVQFRPAIEQLFSSTRHTTDDSSGMKHITTSIRNILALYEPQLNNILLENLVTSLLDAILSRYITALVKATHFSTTETPQVLEDLIELDESFSSMYAESDGRHELEGYLSVCGTILSLLDTPGGQRLKQLVALVGLTDEKDPGKCTVDAAVARYMQP